MTNLQWIRTCSAEQLGEWLDTVSERFDDVPWLKWWNTTYCENCPAVAARYSEEQKYLDFAYCELNHHCKFFPEIADTPPTTFMLKLWLQQEHKDEKTQL